MIPRAPNALASRELVASFLASGYFELVARPERPGDAAELFDPYDVNAMARAMERVLTDDALRAQCVERGLQRAKLYNWRDNVKQTVDIIREVGSTERS